MTVHTAIENLSATPCMFQCSDSLNYLDVEIGAQASLNLKGIDARKLGRLIRANAVAGRIVIEHGSTDTSGATWHRASVIPATLAAVRDHQNYNAWVKLVLNPQRADFEGAADRQRIELSMDGAGLAPRGVWERVFPLNPWAFSSSPGA
ncbi:hypothetical protein [Methylobacterium fujisawaense]|uniref:hypothetical protein n=1 Tax=Methylobacterium fujisawaense TaxID=107400 RepID=UPI00313E3F22